MNRKVLPLVVGFALLVGFALGTLNAQNTVITSSMWEGKSPEEAASTLLDAAVVLADNGSWQQINTARVYYLSGDKDRAESIWAPYKSGKPSEQVRIARVYAQAGEWDKAAPLYEKALVGKPKDADWMAEAGGWYNLNGDRKKAEELFARSFALETKRLKNTLSAAGSYVGVEPRIR